MNKEEFEYKINDLKNQLSKLTSEYIEEHKIYNEGDILRVSFHKCNKDYIYTCKIVNIYLIPNMEFMSTINWPSGKLTYFARFCWKDGNGNILIGDHCPLGELSHPNSENVCCHLGIDYDTLKFEVIKESDL